MICVWSGGDKRLTTKQYKWAKNSIKLHLLLSHDTYTRKESCTLKNKDIAKSAKIWEGSVKKLTTLAGKKPFIFTVNLPTST